jgi:hypothetical protein
LTTFARGKIVVEGNRKRRAKVPGGPVATK